MQHFPKTRRRTRVLPLALAALLTVASGAAAQQGPDPGTLAGAAIPVTGEPGDYGALLQAIGDAPVVLLGESTHGTREFYRERARISERLIRERGFGAVILEADAPNV